MKLNLEKQELTALTSEEMQNIEGGRGGWSNFRTGNCKYSNDMPVQYLVCEDPKKGETRDTVKVGCEKTVASPSTASVNVISVSLGSF